MASMSPVAQLAALIAALIHVGFFYLESIVFARPTVWARFHIASQADADVIRPMALNQGFYNLFLGLGIVAGLVLIAAGADRPDRDRPVRLCLHGPCRGRAARDRSALPAASGHPGPPAARRDRPHHPAVTIPARIGIVTLGVADVARARAFYEAIGWEPCSSSMDEICWFRTADSYLGLFSTHDLAGDIGIAAGARGLDAGHHPGDQRRWCR